MSAGLTTLICLVVGAGCNDAAENPVGHGPSSTLPSTPTLTPPAAGPTASPSATISAAIACKRRATKLVERVFFAFYMHPDKAPLSGVRATAGRLGDQLRQLEAERVCPEMPSPLVALLHAAEPPSSASELEQFSGAYAEWATSVGLGRGLPGFLDDPVWCVQHADEYVQASWVRQSEPAPGGFRVWLDVTFENLTAHALPGYRVGSMTVVDPAGLRRLRDYDGRHVNRMTAGSWGGGTDGPLTLPALTRTTMVMGDANNQPLALPFEALLTGNDIAVKARVGGAHACTFVARPA